MLSKITPLMNYFYNHWGIVSDFNIFLNNSVFYNNSIQILKKNISINYIITIYQQSVLGVY